MKIPMFDKIFGKKETRRKFVPRKYVLFNVEIFNTWFNDKDNDAVYAHSGIFLRLDKLSQTHITDYLEKCHSVNISEWDLEEDIRSFYEEIRKDWLVKIQNL